MKRKWKFKANGCRRVKKITYSGVLLIENVAQLQKPKLCSWLQIIGIEICWHWMLNLSLGFQFSLPIYLFKLWFSCWELEKIGWHANCVCWNFHFQLIFLNSVNNILWNFQIVYVGILLFSYGKIGFKIEMLHMI